MDIIEPIDPIEPDDPTTESFNSSLTGQQIENVLVGIRSVVGVIKRNGENDYSAASASDFDGVEEAPNDGQQYARKNKAWEVVQGGGGGTSDIAWLPSVDTGGNISWTRSTSTTPPTARNIKGPQGSAGISPAVTVSTITGGHRVTITDADHPAGQSFNVMDGSGGGGGVEEAPDDGKSYIRKSKAWTNSVFVFSVTPDGDSNVYLPSGLTVASVFNAFAAGQSVVCHFNDTYYALSSVYIGSGYHRLLTFSHIKGTKGSDVGYAEYIVLDSAASIGNGFTTSIYFGGGTTSPWSGKNVLILGDSGSDAPTYHNNWWQKLSSELGFNTPTVKAYPGYGITAIVNNCTASDVTGKDLIIIEAGANDIGTSLGKVGDLYPAQSTICGKVKYAIETIYTLLANANNLKCRVMFFAPYCVGEVQDGHDGYYYDISGLSQAMEDTANYDGLPCYNAYKESGINSHTWSVYMASASDHVHLNLSGNALIGKSISQFIRDRVLPFEQVNG